MIDAKKIWTDADIKSLNTKELQNAFITWANIIDDILPRFHSPKSRRFKCNKCGKLHNWASGQMIMECDCKKGHIRFLGLGIL